MVLAQGLSRSGVNIIQHWGHLKDWLKLEDPLPRGLTPIVLVVSRRPWFLLTWPLCGLLECLYHIEGQLSSEHMTKQRARPGYLACSQLFS